MENRISQKGYIQPPATVSYNIVSLVGYLIEMKQETFEPGRLSFGVFHDLEVNDNAKFIRCLYIFRSALMKHGDRLLTLMNELRPIDNMPEYIGPEIFAYPASKNLQVIRANQKPMQYILRLNQMIANRINTCQSLFALWINWQYLRKLFIMPHGAREDIIRKTIAQFKSNINIYPQLLHRHSRQSKRQLSLPRRAIFEPAV